MRGRTAAALVALLTLTLLVGCGPEDSPPPPTASATPTSTPTPTRPADPDELLRQATENTWDAASKHLTGTITIEAAGQTKTFDYVFVGSLAKGTQTDIAPPGTSVMSVVKIGDDVYINAGAPYWQWYVSLGHLQYVVDKWVRARYEDYPSTVPVGSSVPAPVGDVTSVGTDIVDGTDVVVLADAEGNRYYVDDDGGPYLLRVEGQQATEIGLAEFRMDFSQIGAVPDVIAAPTGGIVDLYHLPTEAVGHD